METSTTGTSAAFPRCFVCRLPRETLDRVHRDRLEHWVTFEDLAEKCRAAGHRLSDSSLRRHFRQHVPVAGYSSVASVADGAGTPSNMPTVFDNLVGKPVDDRAVLEAATSAVIGKMQNIEAEYEAAVARHPQAAERALAKFLKTMGVLERSLKSLQEARKPREEMKKVVGTLMVTLGRAASEACRDFMQENTSKVRDGVNEFLAGHLRPTHLTERIKWFEEDWPDRFKDRVTEAVKGALKESEELRGWL